MNKTSKQANFKNFTSKVKEAVEIQKDSNTTLSFQMPSYRYLQVRVAREDAHRLKATLSSKGLSIQSVLIEALNLWMSGHGHPPISDSGTAREK